MIDPLPSKYNYPKNNNTNLFYDFKDDYEFYEKLIIGYTFFIQRIIFLIFLYLNINLYILYLLILFFLLFIVKY